MQNQKKILFLASWYPSKEQPTLGNFVQKHAELANEIAEVHVLYATSSSHADDFTIDNFVVNGVNTCIVYYPKLQTKIPVISTLVKRKMYLNALEKGFSSLNNKYDLVHLNVAFPAGLFALRLLNKYKLNYVLTVHWTGFLTKSSFNSLPFYQKFIFRNIFNSAQKVLPVSRYLGSSLLDLGLIKDYEVLPNVVDEDVFYPFIQDFQKNTIPRFIHISTFDNEHKNISGMLTAFSKLNRDYMLHLITESSEEDVWNYIDELKIPREKCIVESKLNSDELSQRLRLADCLVLFSRRETFSVVIAEAWMSGLPVITSKCGGLTEQITSKLGRTVPIDDVKALTQELENFSPNDYSKEAIRTFAMQFSRKELKEQLKQIYDSI